jgi:hypothetical protein
MTIFATGVTTRVSYEKETVWGVAPAAGSAQQLSRITFDSDLARATQESDELDTTYQVRDILVGMRKSTSMLKARLAGKKLAPFIAAALRQAFATGPTTGAVITISAATGAGPHFHRTAGSFIADGFKVGMVISPAGFSGAGVGNNGGRWKLTVLTATDMTVANIDGTAPTIATEAAGASVTVSTPGQIAYVPMTAQTADSFAFEEYIQGIAVPYSWLSTGQCVNTVDIGVAKDQFISADFGFIGMDRVKNQGGSAPYYTTPAAPLTNKLLTTVSGSLRMNGVEIGYLSDYKLKIDGGIETLDPVFSSLAQGKAPGRVKTSGTFSAYLPDSSFADAFEAQTEMALYSYMTGPLGAAGDILAMGQPRVVLQSVKKSDAEKGIIQAATFHGKLFDAGTGIEQTTMWVQDTAMP